MKIHFGSTLLLLLIAALFGCKKDNSTDNQQATLSCNDSVYTNPSYQFERVKVFADNQYFSDPTAGSGMNGTTRNDTQQFVQTADWHLLHSGDSNLEIQLWFQKLFPPQHHISTQDIYDITLPGNYTYATDVFGEGGWLRIQFPYQPYPNEWESRPGDNSNSSLYIEERSPMYVVSGDTFCHIKGTFCCFLYNTQTGAPKPVSGNFSAKLTLSYH